MQNVIRDAIEQHYTKPLATTISDADLADFESKFVDYMGIYQSHWRDDPKFDVTNTATALPHLPCPKLDYDALMRISRYPVERNFIAPRHDAPAVPFDAAEHLAELTEPRAGSNGTHRLVESVGLEVIGPGGGVWNLAWNGERVTAVERGLPDFPSRIYLSAKTLGQIANGSLSVAKALNSGRLVAEGINRGAVPFDELLETMLAPRARRSIVAAR
jgi:hypothetical protein